jgi:hypothetical protein
MKSNLEDLEADGRQYALLKLNLSFGGVHWMQDRDGWRIVMFLGFNSFVLPTYHHKPTSNDI